MVVDCSSRHFSDLHCSRIYQGFLKFGLSLLATLITMILVTFLSPYVSNALVKYTPIDDVIEKNV